MPRLICPHCKKRLDRINVYFEHVQVIDLVTQSGKLRGHVTEEGTIWEKVTDVECSRCTGNVLKLVMSAKGESTYDAIFRETV
jgi:hypothetical protein